ncbi:hypothetical protein EYF80_020975 [Liparis tanakae]|uniref:Uncharacterized protein n=1 Tax=Liparis tanakae TaxID=230148 RepID=A0A4Z2HSU9_9TELE|nr:hypothetical protein EYF80_020975 [Liparis tanakae]
MGTRVQRCAGQRLAFIDRSRLEADGGPYIEDRSRGPIEIPGRAHTSRATDGGEFRFKGKRERDEGKIAAARDGYLVFLEERGLKRAINKSRLLFME